METDGLGSARVAGNGVPMESGTVADEDEELAVEKMELKTDVEVVDVVHDEGALRCEAECFVSKSSA